MNHRHRGFPAPPGRVVVGVDVTLSGMQALRVAVAEARRRSQALHAVRAWGPDPTPPPATSAAAGVALGTTPLIGAGAQLSEPGDRGGVDSGGAGGAMAAVAAATVARAFGETLGGPPDDLEVRSVVLPDPPGPVLVEYACRDGDLLVVGTGRRGLLRRLRPSPVLRYCLSRASCPVLIVPPPPMTRDGSPRALLRQLRREIDEFAEGGGG